MASDKLSEPVCQLTTGYFGLRARFMKRFTVANNLGEPSVSPRDGPDGPAPSFANHRPNFETPKLAASAMIRNQRLIVL
jgi:hypothetical protein